MQGLFRVVTVSDIHVFSAQRSCLPSTSPRALIHPNFRSLLKDDKIITVCARKDPRALFNLLDDAFNELGELRMALNDVVLDPSLAPKVSEAAMNPSKALSEEETAGGAAGWMAVKLFRGEKSTSLP